MKLGLLYTGGNASKQLAFLPKNTEVVNVPFSVGTNGYNQFLLDRETWSALTKFDKVLVSSDRVALTGRDLSKYTEAFVKFSDDCFLIDPKIAFTTLTHVKPRYHAHLRVDGFSVLPAVKYYELYTIGSKTEDSTFLEPLPPSFEVEVKVVKPVEPKVEKVDKVDKVDKVVKPVEPKVEKVDKVVKPVEPKVDKIEKVEKADKVEKVEKLEESDVVKDKSSVQEKEAVLKTE